MKVAHLARKPISEGSVGRNILVHGTGGINIDGIRTFCGTEHFAKPPPPRPRGGMVAGGSDEREGAALGMFRPGATYQPTNHPGGRWPSNVILIHEPDCQEIPISQSMVYGRADEPSETPEDVWECVEGCPARELDEQSDITTNTSNYSYKRSGLPGFIADIPDQPEKSHWHTETGGASRFFKQVKP